jgi:hypothetical protein
MWFKELGVAVAAILVIYTFAQRITTQALKQIEDNNKRMFEFMDDTFKDNTESMNKMISIMTKHIETKDRALEIMQKRYDEEVRL